MNPLINVTDLTKSFGPKMTALDRVNLQIMPGEMVALIGASGSGKSTLLRHLPGLTAADKKGDGGEISILGSTVQSKGRIASDIRRQRQHIGFIFQQFNLVDRLPVLTNVLVGSLSRVPLQRSLLKFFSSEEKTKALEALDRVGIADWAMQKASTLSGGQQQRAAIARALVQEAKIILADEPIASLDPESSRRVMEILANINRVDGITVVVSLHQVEYAVKFCPRVVALKKGRVVFDGPSNTVTNELLRDLYSGDPDVEDPGCCLLPQAAGAMAA